MRFPRAVYNLISLAGAIVALLTAVMIVFLLLAEYFFQQESNPYLGILLYMVLPAVMVAGLILIPIGMVRKTHKFRKAGKALPQWPYVDLNKSTHRNAFFVFVAGTIAFVLISVVGGYEAYHFTESIEFCGTTCHVVMKPEHTAYQNSPHARVACVSCHVGPGADFYAKSKLSGLYQVYAATRDIFPRPIPTPIESLRPARETCEQCHWPRKFFGSQQRRYAHYMYDEENTYWPIEMLIKTGGNDPTTGESTGIHWHINEDISVEYIARDEQRQEIPWVRVTNQRTGEVTVYEDEDDPLDEEEIAAEVPRVMDCVDCHNRPSHNYLSPDVLVDRLLESGSISQDLPEIKLPATEAMAQTYATEDEGRQGIANYILSFYEEEYEDVFEENRADIERAVGAVQGQFVTNMFPEMKVTWSVYPDNIGHMEFPGCFRCHNGKHRSPDGDTITRECGNCHAILAQGSGDRAEWAPAMAGLEFVHPEDIDEAWKEDACTECHEGIQP
jgi:nitrate/TMAO reductase-like tetraheme cytochrome c subunit